MKTNILFSCPDKLKPELKDFFRNIPQLTSEQKVRATNKGLRDRDFSLVLKGQ